MTVSSGLNIRVLYFEFKPVARHQQNCPNAGTNTWETTRYTWDAFTGETRRTVFRFACHACGMVAFEAVDGEMTSQEWTHASQVGYGSKPEKVAGLWLHPGARLMAGDDQGPREFYVTRTKDRPTTPDEVTGVVAWHFGKRMGVRWSAGFGLTGHGTAAKVAGIDFRSRHAAVAWIAGQAAGGEQ